MNPNAGEGGSNQPPTTPTAAVNSPLNATESNVADSNSLNKLEGVVAAAQEAANVAASPLQPTPQQAFEDQFGEKKAPATAPLASAPADLGTSPSTPDLNAALANIETSKDQDGTSVAPLVPGIDTIKDLLDKGPQVEQTPGDKLRQKISADIDAFLEEVTKDKVAA